MVTEKKTGVPSIEETPVFVSGAEGDRTLDLVTASHALRLIG